MHKQKDQVVEFYDSHPISEHQILEKLKSDGHDTEQLTVENLTLYDQDHFGGLAANDRLAELAQINDNCHVLDVCSGMGGPSRYLAHKWGCRVTGIDLTLSRVEGARRLTELVGLQDKVQFLQANALDMPFADQSFDVVISQEAFCHIPDKKQLVAQCARVLKVGCVMAFTDILVTEKASEECQVRLSHEMAFRELGSFAGYQKLFENACCRFDIREDLGALWRDILIDRLAMYRGLKDQTIGRFGNAHFEKWDRAYAHFVGLFSTGELTGGRILVSRL